MFEYPVTLTPDDNGTVLVTFIDIPEAMTFGIDKEDALKQAVDALATGLSFYIDERKPLPYPSQPQRNQKTVCPSALEQAKLGVYQAMIEQGIKKTELARRLNCHLPQIDRLFDLTHASRFDQIEAAAQVLGKHINIQIV